MSVFWLSLVSLCPEQYGHASISLHVLFDLLSSQQQLLDEPQQQSLCPDLSPHAFACGQPAQSLQQEGFPLTFATAIDIPTASTTAIQTTIIIISVIPIIFYCLLAFLLILSALSLDQSILPLFVSTMRVMTTAHTARKMKSVHHHEPIK